MSHHDLDNFGFEVEVTSKRKTELVTFPNSENTHINDSRDATARKFSNKIELLSADLINVQDELLFDIDLIFEITEYSRCPEISKYQNEKIFNSLIDTGSEVTAISEKFNNDNLEYFKSCPTLLTCRKFIKAATGNKSRCLKLQAMILTKINNLTFNLNHMGVPKLIKECIIGIDSQEKLKMVINTEAKNIKITVNDISDSISYNIINAIESKQYSFLNIIGCLDGEND